MFQALGNAMFNMMVGMGVGATKTPTIALVSGETYDTDTGQTDRTVTPIDVTGFWGPFSEDEMAREGLRKQDIRFSFPTEKVSRRPTVDDYVTLDGVKYQIYKDWVDTMAVQTILCLREA